MKKITLVLLLISCFCFTISTCAEINTKEFPKNFLFGTATSSYQVEGAWDENGKGENIWDRFTHTSSELILDGSNGDIACDSYHKVKEDVALIKDLGASFYRFSLSWSRILPNGLNYQINPDGIRYYNELIDTLLENNITPFITIFHWDTPQPLEDLGGFTNELMVEWFEDYARVVFDNFGDRVKWWVTFNEPRQTCLQGYGGNQKAPGYNSSGIGDYLCAHNVLKAHARAYHLYDKKYRAAQNGTIGITLDALGSVAKTESKEDVDAAERFQQFYFGWFANPIFHPNGDYPEVMKTFVAKRSKIEGFKKSRLPTFTEEEITYVKGTYDFFGFNHYTTLLVANVEDAPYDVPDFVKDSRTEMEFNEDWPGGASPWLKVYPDGFRSLLKWIKLNYGDVPIYVTENGYSDNGKLDDVERVEYYKLYLSALLDAMYIDKVNVQGYTAWSLLDNFEWREGYENRFGLYHVDFNDSERKRSPKASAEYLKTVFANRKL